MSHQSSFKVIYNFLGNVGPMRGPSAINEEAQIKRSSNEMVQLMSRPPINQKYHNHEQ